MYSLESTKEKKNIWNRILRIFSGAKREENYKIKFRYRDVVSNLDQLVCVKDADGVYQMANQAFCDLTGLEEREIVGKDDMELGLFLNPEQIMAADELVLETGQKRHIPIEPFTDKFGSLYWFQTKKIPLKNRQNEVIQLLLISSDITQKIEMEQRLVKNALE